MKKLIICGAGGHAKVVLDAILSWAKFDDVLVLDDAIAVSNSTIFGITIIGPIIEQVKRHATYEVHIALGANQLRYTMWSKLQAIGSTIITIKHLHSSCSNFCVIESGCFIAAKAIIAANAVIKHGTIINHGAVIDHDCKVGSFSHIAPNATLGGNVIIGKGCLVGANATILPNLTLGDWVTIGAGAVVTKNIADNSVVKGIPAK